MSVSPTQLFDAPPEGGLDVARALAEAARERILILDGAMGTQIQDLALDEGHFRGERFVGCECHLKGDNDLLTLTQPQAIEDIHFAYAMAGADILETNTFSSTRDRPGRLRHAGGGLRVEPRRRPAGAPRGAQSAAHRRQAPLRRRRAGPTNRTASISPDVNNPGFRAVTFDALREAYAEQIVGLIDGGADIILIETIFDTLNAKAAVFACEEVFAARGRAPAADDLRHDHRPLRAHAVGADADRVLAFAAPRQALHHRPQLRARRERDARAPRRDRGRRRHVRLRLSQRRPAQRIRPLRRDPGRDGGRDRRLSPATAWSTSSAAAAARPPRISARSPKPCAASGRASRRKRRR